MNGLPANGQPVKTLTVLTDPKNIQVKTISPDGVVAATAGEWFTHHDAPFETLEDLFHIIDGLTPNQLVIHAARTAHVNNGNPDMVRCTVHTHRRTGEAPFYQDREAWTVTIDLDDTLVPAGCSWDRVTEMAGRVWSDLQEKNPILQGVGCVWKTSGSAAAPDREQWAKFHFTTILGNPLLWHDRQSLLDAINGADAAMSRVVQKHYLAGRVVKDMVDPLDGQITCGIIAGNPIWWTPTPKPVTNPYEIDVQISDQTSPFGNEKLRIVSSMIQNAPLGTRHDTVLRLSYLIGGYVGGGEIAEADAYRYLFAAVQGYKHPKHHHMTITDAVPAGIDRPRSNVADWAQEILATDFDPKQLAEYAMTLEDDQRDLLLDLMEQHSTSKKKRQYEKHFKAAEAVAVVDSGLGRYEQLIQFGGPMAHYAFIASDELQSASPFVVDTTQPTGGYNRRNFKDLTSKLGTVPQLNADGKVVHTPVADYWWDADTTPRYDVIGFDPNQPLSMVDGRGRHALNTYRPAHYIPAPRGQDVSPFLYLLRANIPDEGDRSKFLGAIAHATQKPGERLEYATVMQGTQGCGKGMLIKWTLNHCCGQHNIGMASPKALMDQFNGYSHHKTVVICDEIGERKWADMTDILENLKEPITEPRIPIRKMRRDVFDADNFATFFFMTNHLKSMLANDPNERRYMHFISALQTPEDVAMALPLSLWDSYPHIATALRASNTATWFSGYALWWRQYGGAEAVRAHLEHDVVALPAGGRAPITTSTVTAQENAVSPMVRVIREAIDYGDLGFGGGFVSSNAIRTALAAYGMKELPPSAVAYEMRKMGYEFHYRCDTTPTEQTWFPQNQYDDVKRPRFTVYSTKNRDGSAPSEVYAEYMASQDQDKVAFGKTMASGDMPPVQ